MIAARSPAERRALLLCLSFGVLAAVLGSIWAHRRLPPPLLEISSDLDFWLAAKILGLDAVLVLAGGRGPRAVALAALAILALLFAFAAGTVLLFSVVWLLSGGWAGSWGWAILVKVLVALGLMSAVQWLSIRAVTDRLHE